MRNGNRPYIPPGCPAMQRGRAGMTIDERVAFLLMGSVTDIRKGQVTVTFIAHETPKSLGDQAEGCLPNTADRSYFDRAWRIAGSANLESAARERFCARILECSGVVVGSDGRPECSALGADAIRQVIEQTLPE